MYLAVKDVRTIENYKLLLTFDDDSVKLFDMKPFLEKGIFKELRDEALFKTARVSFDSIDRKHILIFFALWHLGYISSIYFRVNENLMNVMIWIVIIGFCFGVVLGGNLFKNKELVFNYDIT